MNISKRLEKIANMVDRCSSLADIGTDHGYIPIFLVKKGICDTAIASDINKGPIKKALRNITEEKLNSKIECRQGSGLKTIALHEVEAVVIAGMGGHLIADILEESKVIAHALKFIVLQPVQHSEALRKYLHEEGYQIIDEDLCYDEDKYYEIIKARLGLKTEAAEEINYEVSEVLIKKKHPLLKEFIEFKIERNNNVIQAINEETENAGKKKEFLMRKNAQLEEILKCL